VCTGLWQASVRRTKCDAAIKHLHHARDSTDGISTNIGPIEVIQATALKALQGLSAVLSIIKISREIDKKTVEKGADECGTSGAPATGAKDTTEDSSTSNKTFESIPVAVLTRTIRAIYCENTKVNRPGDSEETAV
jgi:hypothetical protein